MTALLAAPAAAGQQPAPTTYRYTIFVGGTVAGSEDVTVQATGDGLTISGKGRLSGSSDIVMRRAATGHRADFAGRLRTVLGQRLVDLRLFGSVARGDAHPDSDIDILVVVQAEDEERRRVERDVVDVAFDVNLQHDVYISPRVLTPAILAHPVWGQTPFIKAVQRESVTL